MAVAGTEPASWAMTSCRRLARNYGGNVTIWIGPTTWVELDREHGVLAVYSVETGRLMYCLPVREGTV